MSADTILNQYSMTENITTSGYPSKEQFQLIADTGVSTVINLAMPDSDSALANEGEIVTALGMTYIHLPVPWEAPTKAHLLKFCSIVNALGDEKIWIHCQVNARVSAFIYQYLTQVKSVDPESATTPLLKKWRENMHSQWDEFLKLTIN